MTVPSKNIIYLMHPVSPAEGETIESNLEEARQWTLWIYKNFPDIAVLAMWIVDCEVMDDSNPKERALGFTHNLALVAKADAVLMVGPRISGGMRVEMECAKTHALPVFDMTGFLRTDRGAVEKLRRDLHSWNG